MGYPCVTLGVNDWPARDHAVWSEATPADDPLSDAGRAARMVVSRQFWPSGPDKPSAFNDFAILIGFVSLANNSKFRRRTRASPARSQSWSSIIGKSGTFAPVHAASRLIPENALPVAGSRTNRADNPNCPRFREARRSGNVLTHKVFRGVLMTFVKPRATAGRAHRPDTGGGWRWL
jgi:hypothetical protein